ncbi:MAG: hypothetical protein ACFFC7_18195 [Candidatus Hermodarchaeota archaeon]
MTKTVKISEKKHETLKIEAIKRKTNLQDLVDVILEQWIKENIKE